MNVYALLSSCLSKTTARMQYMNTTTRHVEKLSCLRIRLSRSETRKFSSSHRHFSSTERLTSSKAVQPPTSSFPFLGLGDKNSSDDHVSYPITLVLDNGGKTKRREDTVERIDNKRSGARRYKFTADNGEVMILPSVTTVLQNTAPIGQKIALDRWREKIVKQYGAEPFDNMKKITVNNGKIFHQLLEERLKSLWQKPSPPPSSDVSASMYQTAEANPDNHTFAYIRSVEHVLSDMSDLRASESVVCHRELGYSGTVDCVAKYRGHLCAIDWKTSLKPKKRLSDLYEYPLQLVAYAGAINVDENYPFKIDKLLIVIAYPSGADADAHLLDSDQCQRYWQYWQNRLTQHQTQLMNNA